MPWCRERSTLTTRTDAPNPNHYALDKEQAEHQMNYSLHPLRRPLDTHPSGHQVVPNVGPSGLERSGTHRRMAVGDERWARRARRRVASSTSRFQVSDGG